MDCNCESKIIVIVGGAELCVKCLYSDNLRMKKQIEAISAICAKKEDQIMTKVKSLPLITKISEIFPHMALGASMMMGDMGDDDLPAAMHERVELMLRLLPHVSSWKNQQVCDLMKLFNIDPSNLHKRVICLMPMMKCVPVAGHFPFKTRCVVFGPMIDIGVDVHTFIGDNNKEANKATCENLYAAWTEYNTVLGIISKIMGWE